MARWKIKDILPGFSPENVCRVVRMMCETNPNRSGREGGGYWGMLPHTNSVDHVEVFTNLLN